MTVQKGGFLTMRKGMEKYRKATLPLIAMLAVAVVLIAVAEVLVLHAAAKRAFDSIADVPPAKAGLVLGCAKYLANGQESWIFKNRMRSALELYLSGKVEYLIVSGDNHCTEYDEATDMREQLIKGGVPGERIYRDYAGFRTLDSVVRAKKIFGQEKLVIVSQRFHVERAIFLARLNSIDAYGFCARDVGGYFYWKNECRERLARVRAVLDAYLFGAKPKFLGPAIELGGDEPS